MLVSSDIYCIYHIEFEALVTRYTMQYQYNTYDISNIAGNDSLDIVDFDTYHKWSVDNDSNSGILMIIA